MFCYFFNFLRFTIAISFWTNTFFPLTRLRYLLFAGFNFGIVFSTRIMLFLLLLIKSSTLGRRCIFVVLKFFTMWLLILQNLFRLWFFLTPIDFVILRLILRWLIFFHSFLELFIVFLIIFSLISFVFNWLIFSLVIFAYLIWDVRPFRRVFISI